MTTTEPKPRVKKKAKQAAAPAPIGKVTRVQVSAKDAGAVSTQEAPDTKAALVKATELVLDYVEIDVRRTADGVLVVSKAPTVESAGVKVPIESKSFSAIEMVTGTRLLEVTEALGIIRAANKKAHIDLKIVSSEEAYAEPGATHEAEAMQVICDTLHTDWFIVSSVSDDSIRAITAWAEQTQTPVRVGLSLGRGADDKQRFRISELFPGGRVSKTGANFVVATPRLAEWRLMDWARETQTPLLVACTSDQRQLGTFMSDNRVWMVETEAPHLAPRHRAAKTPVLHNAVIGGALGLLLFLFLYILYVVGKFVVDFDINILGL